LERLESLDREALIQVLLDQQRMIEQLRAEIEQLKRRGSAAPFSKGTNKPDPKAPGRKPGQGYFRFRGEPAGVAGAEPIQVPAGIGCPNCGGALGEAVQEIVSTTDIPLTGCGEVRRYRVEIRKCPQCGKSVRGQHPDIAAGQQGATAHRVGARARAAAQLLHYGHGVPVRKVPAILEELTGIRLTQGAITQDAMKQVAGAVGARYAALRESVRKQTVIHTDDTGWRVQGKTAFLMAFVNASLSVYQVRSRHRNEEVRELAPADFAGVMVCDRGKSYDAEELQSVSQQKCQAHLLRNAAEVTQGKTGRARQFSQRLKDLLRQALALGAKKNEMDAARYRERIQKLEGALSWHLRRRYLRDADNQKLLDGVGLQHDRGRLLRFLKEEGLEPTNNRAERDLRPAVIARKVSHCSRNVAGARAFEAFTSVIQTLRKIEPATMAAELVRLMNNPPAIASP
jgi:transposase